MCIRDSYKFQKEWKDTIAPKYKEILINLNKGGILTFEMVRQCIMGEEAVSYTHLSLATLQMNMAAIMKGILNKMVFAGTSVQLVLLN